MAVPFYDNQQQLTHELSFGRSAQDFVLQLAEPDTSLLPALHCQYVYNSNAWTPLAVKEQKIIQISPPTVTPSGPGKSVTVARVSLWPHMILQEGGG